MDGGVVVVVVVAAVREVMVTALRGHVPRRCGFGGIGGSDGCNNGGLP
jgi:hypothetical protein